MHERTGILRFEGLSLQRTRPILADIVIIKNDPHQTTNLASSGTHSESTIIANRPLPRIISRLDALMLVLKSCSEDSCRHPWQHLHPAGTVNSLADALDEGFDEFYADQPKVAFSECSLGYHTWAEGPQQFNAFGQGGDEKRGWGMFGLGWI